MVLEIDEAALFERVDDVLCGLLPALWRLCCAKLGKVDDWDGKGGKLARQAKPESPGWAHNGCERHGRLREGDKCMAGWMIRARAGSGLYRASRSIASLHCAARHFITTPRRSFVSAEYMAVCIPPQNSPQKAIVRLNFRPLSPNFPECRPF